MLATAKRAASQSKIIPKTLFSEIIRITNPYVRRCSLHLPQMPDDTSSFKERPTKAISIKIESRIINGQNGVMLRPAFSANRISSGMVVALSAKGSISAPVLVIMFSRRAMTPSSKSAIIAVIKSTAISGRHVLYSKHIKAIKKAATNLKYDKWFGVINLGQYFRITGPSAVSFHPFIFSAVFFNDSINDSVANKTITKIANDIFIFSPFKDSFYAQ